MKKIFLLLLCFPMVSSLIAQSKNPVSVYAVIVGIKDYINDAAINDLSFSDNDGVSFQALLTQQELGNVPKENITFLANHAATKTNVLDAMKKQFKRADSNDVVIFFFSGHGGEGFLCTSDFDGSSSRSLQYSDIKERFRASDAGKKLCFLDACFAGSVKSKNKSISNKGLKDETFLKRQTAKLTSKTNGTPVFVFASSRPDETSQEWPELKGSVFTHYLVKGLRGEADRNENKKITVAELSAYLKENIDVQQPVTLGTNIALNTIVFALK